jgi:hypothetical protein
MPSEMFPPGVRSKAVGVAISTNWLTNVCSHFPSPPPLPFPHPLIPIPRKKKSNSNITSEQFIVALITPRMLKSITFGTFYFFLVFCLILIVWVYFCVPETKGLRIEEMDQIFGGNQGVEDMARISDIRRRLGIVGNDREGDFKDGDGMFKGSEDGKDKICGMEVSHYEA